MGIRRGPATVTGSGAAGRKASHWGDPGRRGAAANGSQETCLRPSTDTAFEELEQLVRRRPWAFVPALLVLLAIAGVLSGCETRAQEAPGADAPAAILAATAGYGADVLLETRVDPGQSVMRATRGATEVDAAYAGAFVAAMLGHESDRSGQRDWFFFVNGAVSPVGAEEVRLADGDSVWWDFRFWGDLVETPIVVGQWPAPWALPGRRGGPVAADPPLDATLRAAGADLVDGDAAWRVRVGTSDEVARRDPVWRRALADPDAAGLTVTIAGGRIVAIGPDGGPRQPVDGARAIVAAVPTRTDPGDGALMVVAGLDATAARAAAEAVARDPGILSLRYAVALDGAGTVLRAGGRTGP